MSQPAQSLEIENTYAAAYDAEYYRSGCGPIPYGRSPQWLDFFGGVAEHIVRSLRPESVLDAGCAMGLLVEALWDRGVPAQGIDISHFAISQVRRDMAPYCSVGTLADPIPGRFDLITCIEVIEHIPGEITDTVIGNLCGATDRILFSSTPFDLEEPTHFNVRPLLFWLRAFARFDFWPDLLFDASFISQHAMLLRRGEAPSAFDSLTLFDQFLRRKTILVASDSKLRTLTSEIATQRERNEELAVINNRLAEELAVVNKKLADELQLAESAKISLTTTLSGLELERTNLVNDLGLAESARNELSKDLARVEKEREFEAAARALAESKADKLSAALDRLDQENVVLIERITESETNRLAIENEAFSAKTHNETLTAMLVQLKENEQKLEAQCTAYSAALVRAEQEKTALAGDLQTLKAQHDAVCEELARVKKDLEIQATGRRLAEWKADQLSAAFDLFDQEKAALMQRIAGLESKRLDLENEAHSAKAHSAELATMVEELRREKEARKPDAAPNNTQVVTSPSVARPRRLGTFEAREVISKFMSQRRAFESERAAWDEERRLWQSELAQSRIHAEQLQREFAAQVVRLEDLVSSMKNSPGWRFIERYRTWRQDLALRHPRLMRPAESFAQFVLSLAGAPTPAAMIPASSELPVGTPVMPVVPYVPQSVAASPAVLATNKFFLIISGCPGDAYRYRVDHQAEELRMMGLSVDTALFDQVDYESVINCYEAFLMHRVPHTPGIEEFIKLARAMGKPVIFDTDDLIFNEALIPHIKATRTMSQPEFDLYVNGVRRYHHTLSLCSAAIVTTDHLHESVRELFPDLPVEINRNAVSEVMLRQARAALDSVPAPGDGVIRLAYLSGTRTHQDDFAECENAIFRLLSKHPNVKLMIVGHLDIPDVLKPLLGRIEVTPLIPWGDLPALMRRVDINLAPLEMDNRFTAAKSELKYFEAALLGVPTVASNVPAFQFAITHGQNGMLASNSDEWFQCLEHLVLDPGDRARMGESARLDAHDRYATRARAPQLFSALRKLIGMERMLSAPPLSVAFVVRAPIAQTGGGYKNIFLLAHYLAGKGHDVHIYTEPIAHLAGKTEPEVVAFCEQYFGRSKAHIHLGHDRILPCDVAIATNWPTAYTVHRLETARSRAYLVQDYEPEFYPVDDPAYMEADRTYDLPLRKVALGRYLATLFGRRDRIPVPHMKFSLNRSVFKNLQIRPADGPPRILFFARPGLLRRAYPVGKEALRLVARACPQVQIAFYGMAEYEDLGFPYENLGELTQAQVAEAMNQSHIHLSFSLTNISWVPFEAMACGCAVVEAKVPSVELWMEGDPNCCLLAEPTPQAVAAAVIDLIEDHERRRRMALAGERYVDQVSGSWEDACAYFEQFLRDSVLQTDGLADNFVN